ncbi:ABC transporter substrate binding protein [Konateibacter massiliensis]|uniref:ABC transporter substrate binding protein n=1 Tax=Konateibacter massiliensis TaxID=2002841 RepID=UPI000C145CC2|nr:ABC transporter substrate binding protein [Konateibacter massiliensis]
MRNYLFVLIILTIWFLSPCQQQVQAADLESKNILILNSYHSGFQWTDDQTEGMLNSLSKSDAKYNISIEYMDWKRYPTQTNLDNVYKSLKDKYASQTTDIILCTDDAAFSFALKYRSEIFSDAPIVFSGVNSTGASTLAAGETNYTGTLEIMEPEKAIRTALVINPDIKDIYLIYDNTESGISTGELCIKAANSIDSSLNVISLNQESSVDILSRLSAIDKNSMILMTTYFMDTDGHSINHEMFCEKLSAVSPVPVYHLYDFGLGHGIFGGYMTSGITQGWQSGELALQILNGKDVNSIPILQEEISDFTYDYQVMKKYQISEKLLPEKTQVINEPFSFFEEYRTLVLGVLFVFLLLVVFTIILLFYIRKINHMKKKLQEKNEELTALYEELSATEEELRANVESITVAHEQLGKYSDRLEYLAYHDVLTGLYNRLYLYKDIDVKLQETSEMGALYFVDLDNFKFVNDALGHNIGDILLNEIGVRLSKLASETVKLVRLEGDEFVLILCKARDREEIRELADKIVDSFSHPFNIVGNQLTIGGSIGIAVFPENGKNVDELLRNADMAMYQVKSNGKNSYSFFNTQLKEKIMERIAIENNLKSALKKGEFQLHYQPQINIITDTIDGFEALLRWNNEVMGMVSPLKFIPVAEETGFITVLGEWILQTACDTIVDMNRRVGKSFNISVNISVTQLVQDNFISIVENVLGKTGLSPELLELEITESVIMESPELVTEKIRQLRMLGIKIAIDDFGTGYSSLSYLRKIPITTLKIDKMFVDDIANVLVTTEVTDAIIDLGHKMNLTIVAEGVETQTQLDYLKENGCDKIQGFFYSKPLPIAALEEFIARY